MRFSSKENLVSLFLLSLGEKKEYKYLFSFDATKMVQKMQELCIIRCYIL